MTAQNRYYIRFRGMVTGPLEYDAIARQVRLGQITRLHELSGDGQTYLPANTLLPELFSDRSKPASPPPLPHAPSQKKSREDVFDEYPAIDRQKKKVQLRVAVVPVYIAAGLVLLVDALLPHTTAGCDSQWFFNGFSGTHANAAWGGLFGFVTGLFSLMFAGLPGGKARGWLFFALGALGVLLTGLCAATVHCGWYIFPAGIAILISASAVGAAIASFSGSQHVSLGITACLFTLIAAAVSMTGLFSLNEELTPTLCVAEILMFAGWGAMLISSFAAIFAGSESLKSGEIVTNTINICISAGFGTVAWLMLAMSCFFVLPVTSSESASMTALPLLRLVIAWICLGILAGGAVADITCNQQGDTNNVSGPDRAE